MFEDRQDAGRKLAQAFEEYRGKGALVLGIPRGGVNVAYEVARELGAELSLVVVRKLPFPDNPEAGFGAIAEDGSVFMDERATSWLSPAAIEQIVEEQKAEVQRRIRAFRGSGSLPALKGRTVILVDDGIATGSTMRAAILLCKNQGAGEIVVASPVASSETVDEMKRLVDRVFVLEMPAYFRAVAQVYRRWYDVPDHEVLAILDRWRREQPAGATHT